MTVYYGIGSDGDYYIDFLDEIVSNITEDISWWMVPGTWVDYG